MRRKPNILAVTVFVIAIVVSSIASAYILHGVIAKDGTNATVISAAGSKWDTMKWDEEDWG